MRRLRANADKRAMRKVDPSAPAARGVAMLRRSRRRRSLHSRGGLCSSRRATLLHRVARNA
eukprot:7275803-Alexandrium_andersonii.AAC.1